MSMVERVAEAIELCENRWSAEHLARAAIAAMLEGMMTDHQKALEVALDCALNCGFQATEEDIKRIITAYLAAIGVVVDERNIQ